MISLSPVPPPVRFLLSVLLLVGQLSLSLPMHPIDGAPSPKQYLPSFFLLASEAFHPSSVKHCRRSLDRRHSADPVPPLRRSPKSGYRVCAS
uniref:Putative secreted protein n=1 Tax=Anopheles darlingi TaxID=43151 RepID=A0A2M4D610_ANODA